MAPKKPEPKEFEWPDRVGGVYVSEGEKDELINGGTPFVIVGAQQRDDDEYGSRAEWLLDETVEIEGEDTNRILAFAFGGVQSRDAVLEAMMEHFRKGGAPINATLVKRGRVKLIMPVRADEDDEGF